MNNDDKLREQMKSEPVPEKLRPENIKIMLDNEASKKKRSGISMAGRIAAAAAACAVIGGTAVYTMNNRKINDKLDKNNTAAHCNKPTSVTVPTTELITTEDGTEVKKLASYMSGAKSYRQVYTMFKKASEEASANSWYGYDEAEERAYEAVGDAEFSTSAASSDDGMNSGADSSYGIGGGGDEMIETPIIEKKNDTKEAPDDEKKEATTESASEDSPEHSETYYQEQDVLEADIVKTDGKHIYYLGSEMGENYSSTPVLRAVNAKDGKFTGSTSVNICDTAGFEDNGYNVSAVDMFIYNDMIAIIGNNNNSNFYSGMDYRDYESGTPFTFVAFYTTGDEPQLIDVYKQDGYYNDVRISPDGYMLLTSTYTTAVFDTINGSDDTRNYIPCCGFAESYKMIPPEDILLPLEGFQSTNMLSYTVIGSLDMNKAGAPSEKDRKTLAGYTGSIYCSADNLYTAAMSDKNTTDITRISISGGDIVPMAGANIEGHVKDQFSMSEYGGCFRVAATYNQFSEVYHTYADDSDAGYYTYETIKKDTRVYVLDMDMNMVGKIEGLGEGEELKSASFSGNMAYVVTFRQTDPLYAVDLSDPANPVLLDELKINGFSTYMQQWDDGLLIGFGQDADDDGITTGIKLTLFDNSDPNDLKVTDTYTWSFPQNDDTFWTDLTGKSYEYFTSIALWERKALLIAPEKNIIGIPIDHSKVTYGERQGEYGGWDSDSVETFQYVFFGVEDGRLVRKGDITEVYNGWDYGNINSFNRAVYIGDYVYTLSSKKFVAADIDTLEITDELTF